MNPEDNIVVDEEPTTRSVRVTNSSLLDANTTRKLRMTQVIAKFASTLTLRPIKVELSKPNVNNNHPDVPAWSDSDNIWFNEDTMGDLSDPKTVTSLKGLSLHEISHILLTPRTGSNIAKDVQREGLWRAFNALEDQRIEMMMTKRFGNVSDWLAAAVAQFLIDEPEAWDTVYPLTHGRKYLPKELRKQLRDMYEQQGNVTRIGQLIDQYILLNLSDPKNYPIALDIIREYDSLVNMLPPIPNPQGWGVPIEGWERVKDPSGHDKRKHGEWKSSKSKPMSKADQEKLSQRLANDLANSNGGDESMDSDNEGETSQQGASSSGVAKLGTSVGQMAEQIVTKVLTTKARDIAHTMKQYNADIELTSINAGTPPRLETTLREVSVDTTQASRSFANELERLRADHDPGWNRRVEAGKLNVQRYVTGTDLDECFDEWDMGREDAVDIEAVILLDISGSMSSMIHGACESMWAIKRALDKVNANTTVLAFDHEPHLIYSADERASARMKAAWSRGGTDPLAALKYTKNILADSNRAIKVCIVLTDGTWGYSDESDKLLREFRRAGVLTALGYIEDASYSYRSDTIDSHGCEVAVNITDMSDLFTLSRVMVKMGVERNLVGA